MIAPPGPEFSIREIPFSYRGSWFDISPVVGEHAYADHLHLVSHQNGIHPVLRLVPISGDGPVGSTATATPSRLTWCQESGRIDLAYESADTVRISGRGLGLAIIAADPVLTPFSGPYLFQDPVDGAYVFTLYETGRRYRVTVLSDLDVGVDVAGVGALATAERGVVLPAGDRAWEVAIEEIDCARTPYRPLSTFEQVVEAARTEFTTFVDAVAPWRDRDTPAAELAAYVLWSATVRPAGYLTRPAVLMSKHWMDKVWSWDHCFNALALTGVPDLAWDQFRLVFDHQDAAGALPDSVTHSEVLYNFVKPPIHGWTLRRLRRQLGTPDPTELTEIYQRLADWTRFWLTFRRAPGHDLAHYHHGNDSGWDNATTFDPERVVESADLAAFLVLQLRELAELARLLDCTDQAAGWTAEADRMRAALLDQLWTGHGFRTRGALSGSTWTSTSLLDLMPVVLGAELPAEISARLAERLRAHLTPYGLATELPSSVHYRPDGYWRGPVWAPSTVLIEDGLRRAGHTDLADEISHRFRALCESSGFAENFDALTGAGQRDRAYTWTASSYLILAAAHRQRQR